ncbi:MAG: hypothetical protein AAF717_13275 [Bacteroidota bacterium]
MKTLKSKEMESVIGGGTPSIEQVQCYAIATFSSFAFSLIAGALMGAACLFLD